MNKEYDQSSSIENILKQMASALKTLRIYPAQNPIPAQAIKKFYQALEQFLEGEGGLRIKVTKECFICHNLTIEPTGNELISSLLQELYTRGLSQITFFSSLTEEELTNFLSLLNLEPQTIRAKGGLSSLLWEKEIVNIIVQEVSPKIFPPAQLSEVEALEKEFPHQNLLELMLEKISLSPEETKIILNFLSQADNLTEIIKEALEKGDLETIYQSIIKIAQVFRQELPDIASHYFRNLIEAILSLDEKTRNELFSKKLLPHLEEDELAPLFSQLSVPELVNILSTAIKDKEIPIQKIPKLIEKLNLSEEANKETLILLGKRVAGIVPLLRTFENSIKEREEKQSLEGLTLEEKPLEDIETTLAIETTLEFTEEEKEKLQELIKSGNELETALPVINTLIDMLSLEDKFENFSQILTSLENLMPSLISAGEFNLSVKIVNAFRDQYLSKSNFPPKFRERLNQSVRKAASPDKINQILSSLQYLEKESEEFKRAYSYLLLLDRSWVVTSLLELLAQEKQISMRKLILNLLVDLGQHEIPILGNKVNDPRWYLVRNVVTVLGLISREEALPYLAKVISHPDSRVRHEVIKALGAIGGKKAYELMASVLEGKDAEDSSIVIKIAAKTKNPQMVPHLAKIIEERDFFGKKIDLKKMAVDALSQVATPEVIPVLEKCLQKKSFLFRARNKEIKKRAIEALKQIGTPQALEVLQKAKLA